MPHGIIKKLEPENKIGYINAEKGDMFFHHSAVKEVSFEELRIGQLVDYQIGRGPKGPRAENVTPL